MLFIAKLDIKNIIKNLMFVNFYTNNCLVRSMLNIFTLYNIQVPMRVYLQHYEAECHSLLV